MQCLVCSNEQTCGYPGSIWSKRKLLPRISPTTDSKQPWYRHLHQLVYAHSMSRQMQRQLLPEGLQLRGESSGARMSVRSSGREDRRSGACAAQDWY
jgi:hypothetical protein